MSLRKLPSAEISRPQAYHGDAPVDALERWSPRAAEADDAATISVYDVIGEDWWTGEGVTASRIAGALRSIGKKPVTVNVNSPGGDMFEGLAIYNLLREHPAEVTVRVMGLAASAASVIAMAGDRIEMGLGSFLMIHNSWGGVVGDQNDMRAAAGTFAEFDAAMADIYAARTGMDAAAVSEMMNAETWLRAEAAIEAGFADGTFEAPDYDETQAKGMKARAALDATLARAGLPRSERRRLLREAAGTPGAAGTATPSAGFDEAALRALISTIKA
ncbi:head maturation protease, ClpP-related [Rhodovulum sp. MB263]|uniref:head maturation protease, ClpP-related n=1 Tax=Rhodovulum sp. (strain MB263) TaxID=308754 RepID=UPI0009B73CD6|nr:head maturation protease, ClpP-related [Rhodovulum sp. MB263]ARC87133.1 peptidase [Rhodovulum sp. MB263]